MIKYFYLYSELVIMDILSFCFGILDILSLINLFYLTITTMIMLKHVKDQTVMNNYICYFTNAYNDTQLELELVSVL